MFSQLALTGSVEPAIDLRFCAARRVSLGGGSWIDRCPAWVDGHPRLFETLRDALPWRSGRRVMYDRVVEVPRLLASAPPGERPPIVEAMVDALSARYGERLDQVTFALYRDGRDSVAMHQDKVLKEQPRSTVAIVSLGGPRRFLVRPRGGGDSRAFGVGLGDLLVMGARCQRDFEHGVPKVARAAPRMAIMFRGQRLYGAGRATPPR